ncbi:MAG: DUF4435 domain-containing protein, partial [Candidatus Taylorbacteria bacterium]
MSENPSFTAAGFRGWIDMSDDMFLLVEGDDDKRLFKRMVRELLSDKQRPIHIYSAQDFIDTPLIGQGCREKVETISQIIEQYPYASRYVGFVDREFRDFEIGDKLKDNLNKHQVSGRLIWSRGHSIENYYLDFSTLLSPLRVFSTTQYFDQALDLFERYFESIIRLACAASLVGKECDNRLNLVKSSIGWELMRIHQNQIVVDLDLWKEHLIKKQKLQVSDATHLVECFQKWTQVVENADFEDVRWLCHGHIGLAYVWASYG